MAADDISSPGAQEGADSSNSVGTGDDPLVAAVAATITSFRTRRVPLPDLRRAFARHDPTGAASTDSRTRLADALHHLERRGLLVLPKMSRLYETHLQPNLPLWVERPAAPRPARPAAPVRVWRPELAAAAALARTPEQFDVLTAVDTFLRQGGHTRPLVPHRERSVELFGHEKRLDALVKTRLFTTGVVTFDLLRCYEAPLPLTAQHTGNPGPAPALLIVENSATYASALRAARERVTLGQFGLAVGYGSGNHLPRTIAGTHQLDPVPKAIWYFGDVDEGGLLTAIATATAAENAGLPPVRPAVPLYAALFKHGVRQPGVGRVPAERSVRLTTTWFDDTVLADQAAGVLEAGERIAQEHVGYECLSALPTWF